MLHATAVSGSDSHHAAQPVEQQTPRRDAAWPRDLHGWDRQRIPMIQSLTAGTLLTALMAGCGGGGPAMSGPTSSSGAPGAGVAGAPGGVAVAPWVGHFVGTVTIGGSTLFGDALLATDGGLRLYVGGPYSDSGALQIARPENSEQLIGTLTSNGSQASGNGVVIGQQCAGSVPSHYCGQAAPASFEFTGSAATGHSSRIAGQIQVVTSAGAEAWSVDLAQWPVDALATPPIGQYKELLAEFASPGDVVINVDAAGALFFQSAHSGCVGNGAFDMQRDDSGGGLALTLTIESCSDAFAYLNGVYDGLASGTPSSVWDYDLLLRVWLSRRTGSGAPAALTLLAEPL